MASKRSGFAVQIVTIQSGKVQIDLNALLPILEKVGDHPLAIMSVNGPMRTGKSYLLGYFMRFLGAQGRSNWMKEKLTKEFQWKSSADRQTTGILVWSEPFLLKKDGGQIAVLLMDTQGSFDDVTDYSINYMLFTLSYLLSSVFVYNVKYLLSEDVLQFLQLFLGFAKMTAVDKPFVQLVVVIRDWQNPKDYAYGYHDDSKPKERNFLKDKVEVKSHMAQDAKEAHVEVIQSFQSVACCLLPYPGEELAVRGETGTLDEDFLTVLEEFVPRVCGAENVVHKTTGSQIITGVLMAENVKEWDKLFAKVPFDDVKSLASMAAEKQNYVALSISLNAYKKQMDAIRVNHGFTAQELEGLHDKARGEAVAIFKKQKRMRYHSIEKEYLKNLETQIQIAYESYQEMNETLRKLANMIAQSEVRKIDLDLHEIKADMKYMKENMEQKEKVSKEKTESRLKQDFEAIKHQLNKDMNKNDEEPKRMHQEMQIVIENQKQLSEKMIKRWDELIRLKEELNKINKREHENRIGLRELRFKMKKDFGQFQKEIKELAIIARDYQKQFMEEKCTIDNELVIPTKSKEIPKVLAYLRKCEKLLQPSQWCLIM